MRTMDAPDLSQIRVLVADDEPKLRALVSNALRSLGCAVLEAQDGAEAWHLARGHRLDVVVLDVMMPGMSGWDVCRRIKTDPAWNDSPRGAPKVLMLTGIGEQLNEITSPLFAADAWIDKPFSLRALTAKVAELAGMDASAPSSLPPDLLPDEPIESDPTPAPPPPRPTEPGPSVKKAAPTPEQLEAAVDDARPARAKAAPKRAAAKPKGVKAAPKRAAAKPKKVKAAPKRAAAKPKKVKAAPKRAAAKPKKVKAAPKRAVAKPKKSKVAPKRAVAKGKAKARRGKR